MDWESRCGQRGYKAREMQEEVGNNPPQITNRGVLFEEQEGGCFKRGWRKTRKAPERKGKRRGSWGDSTEERRRAVRDKGRLAEIQVCSSVRTRWGPRSGLGRGMCGARARGQMTGQPRLAEGSRSTRRAEGGGSARCRGPATELGEP